MPYPVTILLGTTIYLKAKATETRTSFSLALGGIFSALRVCYPWSRTQALVNNVHQLINDIINKLMHAQCLSIHVPTVKCS